MHFSTILWQNFLGGIKSVALKNIFVGEEAGQVRARYATDSKYTIFTQNFETTTQQRNGKAAYP